MKEKKKYISILFPVEMYQELETLAARSGRSLPLYIRQIVRRYLQYRGDIVEPMEYFAGRELAWDWFCENWH